MEMHDVDTALWAALRLHNFVSWRWDERDMLVFKDVHGNEFRLESLFVGVEE